MIELVQTLVSWLNVFVAACGAVVCALHLGRSPWVVVLTGGFAVEAVVLVFFRLGVILLRNPAFGGSITFLFVAASVVGALARVALVVGVAGVLSGLPRPSKSPAPPSPGN